MKPPQGGFFTATFADADGNDVYSVLLKLFYRKD
jgi:hypothetical protein